MNIILDESVPQKLRLLIEDVHTVVTAWFQGWSGAPMSALFSARHYFATGAFCGDSPGLNLHCKNRDNVYQRQTMTVTIRPDDEQLIAEVIRTGAYRNADEVIARALEVLRSDEEWLDESRSAIGEKIDRAFEQFDRGQYFSADASKVDMEARKAAWLRGQQA